MGMILKAILLKLVTKAFLTKIVLIGLEKLAESSDNEVDDEIVAAVKEALAE